LIYRADTGHAADPTPVEAPVEMPPPDRRLPPLAFRR